MVFNKKVTVIFSPYHLGHRDHRVGNGPNRIKKLGILDELKSLELDIEFVEIERVDEFEGEIGRSFEVLRRISKEVSKCVSEDRFPLVLAGNCMSTIAIACGMSDRDFGFVYFDAHDDLDSPDNNENGYFDAMGLSMLRGESWKYFTSTIPGFKPLSYDRFLYVGLRDQSDFQRQNVINAGMDLILGSATEKVDFNRELKQKLMAKDYTPALVHLDLDVLDESYGKVNDFPSPGGIFEDDLFACMKTVGTSAKPLSLTVCSFDPNAGDGDKIAAIGIKAIKTFFEALIDADI